MTDNTTNSSLDLEVASLIRHIRSEDDCGHIALFCADISSKFAEIARHVGKVGFSLSDEWRSAHHMVLSVREGKHRLLAIHIRNSGDHDNQTVNVSDVAINEMETEPVLFSLPEDFSDAKAHVLGRLFAAFPRDKLVLPIEAGPPIPLFVPVVANKEAATWDEDVIRVRAVNAANNGAEGIGPCIRSPYADDNLPQRSFARR